MCGMAWSKISLQKQNWRLCGTITKRFGTKDILRFFNIIFYDEFYLKFTYGSSWVIFFDILSKNDEIRNCNSWITHSLKRPPLCLLSTGTVPVYSMLWKERENWHYSLSIGCETSETYCTIMDFSILKEVQCLCCVQSLNELVNRNAVANMSWSIESGSLQV